MQWVALIAGALLNAAILLDVVAKVVTSGRVRLSDPKDGGADAQAPFATLKV